MKRTQIIPTALQEQINAIENTELVVAEIALEQITAMPDYDQVIRIKDTIINLSEFNFIPKPKRILIHKVTNEEMDLGLRIEQWDLNRFSESALIDSDGQRILVDTNYYDEEDNLIETKQEPIHVNGLKYLTFLSHQFTLPELYGKFLQQYVDDIKAVDEDYFTRLK